MTNYQQKAEAYIRDTLRSPTAPFIGGVKAFASYLDSQEPKTVGGDGTPVELISHICGKTCNLQPGCPTYVYSKTKYHDSPCYNGACRLHHPENNATGASGGRGTIGTVSITENIVPTPPKAIEELNLSHLNARTMTLEDIHVITVNMSIKINEIIRYLRPTR